MNQTSNLLCSSRPLRSVKQLIAFLSCAWLAPLGAQAQLVLTSATPKTENFNGMGSSATAAVPAGFRLATGTTGIAYGNPANTSATVRAGGTSGTGALSGNSGGGDYNFADGVTATSTDRALGFLTSSNAAATSPRHILLKIENTTGAVIKDLKVDFSIEKYRTGTAAFDWKFYSSSDDATWVAQTDGDQTFPASTAIAVVNPATVTSETVTIANINLAAGGVFYLRWSHIGGPVGGQGLGLDDVVLTPTLGTGTPTPTATIATTASTFNSPYCVTAAAGSAPFDVAYTTTGSFTGTFKVQLSDAMGAFPTNTTDNIIGSGSASPISASIPAGTPSGTGYRVRVLNDAPVTYGSNNGTSLTVNLAPASNPVTVSPTAPQTFAVTGSGTTITATATTTSTYTWQYSTSSTGPFLTGIAGATAATYQPRAVDFGGAGTYYVVAQATSIGACNPVTGQSAPVAVTITAPTPQVVVSQAVVPDFGSLTTDAASAAKSFTVSGSGLTAPLLITPPAGFEIRTGTQPFSCCVIELQPNGGTIGTTTIEVRFAPTAVQAYQATIPVSSTGLAAQSVAVSGTSVAPVYPATLSTAALTNITPTSATTGGTIITTGGSAVIAQGVVWGSTPNPVLGAQQTADADSTGTFSSTITGLTPGTTYYVRAYATNGVGTTYGDELTLTTEVVPLAAEPTQSATPAASQITGTSLLLTLGGGNGAKRLVLVQSGSTVDGLPVDATTYRDSTAFGLGARLASSYVLYAGTADTVRVTGLRPNSTYSFAVFDYNDNNTLFAENYLTTAPGLLTSTTQALPATLLLEENFAYTAGDDLTANGWAAHSGTTNPVKVVIPGLSFSGYSAATGNAAALTTTGQDVNRAFAPVYARTPVYVSLLVRVASAGTADYFFHLGPATIGSTFKNRVYARRGSTASKVQFGISGNGMATSIIYDTNQEYNVGETYLLVLKYTFDETGSTSQLFVNPPVDVEPTVAAATSLETTGAPTSIGTVALRQGSSTPNLVLDGIRVGTTYRVVRTGLTCLEPAPAFAAAPVCAGTPTVFVDSSAVVEANARYAWDVDGNGTVDYTTKGGFSHTYTAAGTYTATLTIAQGTCTTTYSRPVTVRALPTATLSGTATICTGTSTALTLHLTGEAPWQVRYSTDGGATAVALPVTAAELTADGNYSLSVSPTATTIYSLVSVTDANCTATALTGTATVTVNTPPVVTVPTVPTATAAYGQTTASVSFEATATGTPAPAVTYSVVRNGVVTPITSPYNFAVGTTTVTATAINDCGTVTETFPVTVQATVASLAVLHQNADNSPTNNAIKPNLQLVNLSAAAIPYQQLTVRYWLTVEDFAATVATIDWAQLGTNAVRARYVALTQPVQGAFGYVEYSFTAAAGSLSAGANSGPIQSRINKQTYTNFNEADDYSYATNNTYQQNGRITIYRNGVLVGGTEPAPVAAVPRFTVLSQNRANKPVSNTISTYLQVRNDGNTPVAYQDLTVRYWFSPDGPQPLNAFVDYAQLGTNNVNISFGQAGTETYAELRFAAALGTFSPLSSTGNVQYRLAKSNWSNFNQANDFSYQVAASALAANPNITAYVQGQLVYGQEPAGAATAARGVAATPSSTPAATEAPSKAAATSYPNPFTGSTTITFTAAQSSEYQLDIFDMNGRLVQRLKAGNAQAGQVVQVEWQATDVRPGVYMARLTTGSTVQQLKLVRQ
ncbi:T9SS type A sorting domain-containing protein [Hymenobacter sp. BT186]|uniref:T9SS type A sorting domain-containing protein n=1 Tax=Hymenobacter telluris TaxID=2816474 RepID=A0A939JBS7_9BACT|nr:cellulose binding domain-containing protein [Hymenobacter telluris]MBO0356577.1 T9SS type A sorting domain-containing protein [Hymenobacter telluris]MBW3372602.1 T9SS type A sorting domain-containing protein [Hymenobacter norwichensis]